MSENSLSTAEAFHNGFFYFLESLSTMALDADKKHEVMASANAAWELQQDVLAFGAAVINCADAFLDQSQKVAIEQFLEEVKSLPPTALSGGENAMNHPHWVQLGVGAAHLIALLASPIEENQAFFKK